MCSRVGIIPTNKPRPARLARERTDTRMDTTPMRPRQLTATLAFVLALSGPVSAQATDYVIVTSSEIRALSQNLDSFVAAKEDRGFVVHVFDEMDWGGTGLSGDAARVSPGTRPQRYSVAFCSRLMPSTTSSTCSSSETPAPPAARSP